MYELRALGHAWSWFRDEQRTTPHRIGLRTGQVFKLHDDKKLQFQECRYKGYTNEDNTPRNLFCDFSFLEAHVESEERNRKRRRDQVSRKRKKEEKKLKEINKKKKKNVSINKEESKSPILSPSVKLEPIDAPFLLPPLIKKERRNIQKEIFEDKSVGVEDFLINL